MNLRARLLAALDEDLGPSGDLTTDAIIDPTQMGRGEVKAKQKLVVAGQDFVRAALEATLARVGGFGTYKPLVSDGTVVSAGTVIGIASGHTRTLLIAERLMLNLSMRACGIATHVRASLDHVGPKTFRAVDTRKTTPLWRDLEKAAVRAGGGHNHRFGLFDGVLIKDNHVAAAGGVEAAVDRAKRKVHHLIKIEVEVGDLAQVQEALDARADGLLLDNMTDTMMVDALGLVEASGREVFVEASGNMNAERMKAIAAIGLDVVSVGGFVHQATWADLSMKVKAGSAAEG